MKPGDRIRVQISNVPEHSKEYQIPANGFLNLPLVGGIQASGMTLEQLEALTSAKYTALAPQTEITITLVQLPLPARSTESVKTIEAMSPVVPDSERHLSR